MVSREEFERAFRRLGDLNTEFNNLFKQVLDTEDYEEAQEWVIKNQTEVERLSKIIIDYKKEGKI